MATIDVKDASGSTIALEKPLAPNRAPAASSRPVVLSDEDLAKLEAIRLLLISTLDALTPSEDVISATNPLPVYSYGFDVSDVPTVTNGAYSAGDVVGGYRTVTLANVNDGPIWIAGVQVTFKAAVQPNIRVVLLGATPGATLADNAAYTLSGADSFGVRRTLSSLALGAVYNSHGTPKTISLAPPPFVMKPIAGGKTVGYYLIDDTGATLTSTGDVQVRFSGASS